MYIDYIYIYQKQIYYINNIINYPKHNIYIYIYIISFVEK